MTSQITLKNVLKALLFSTSEPLALSEIKKAIKSFQESLEEGEEVLPFKATDKEIEEAIKAIKFELEDNGEPYKILESANGYSLAINEDYAEFVRILRDEERPVKLSPAILETLSIIAYRQPVTRAELEMIRGVSVDNALTKLLERELIFIQGQADLPGKPRLYATTNHFLEFCGIKDLRELPSSDVISKEKLDEWVKESGKRENMTQQDLGLPSEE